MRWSCGARFWEGPPGVAGRIDVDPWSEVLCAFVLAISRLSMTGVGGNVSRTTPVLRVNCTGWDAGVRRVGKAGGGGPQERVAEARTLLVRITLAWSPPAQDSRATGPARRIIL